MAASTVPPSERRGHVRFAATELNGLRGARVKYGQSIDIIDLSAGGVLFETAGTLAHEATIVLEFSGPTKSVLIPSRVVRCRRFHTVERAERSQGACAFKRPLGLKDLVVGAVHADRTTMRTIDGETDVDLWLPVIGKYRDGRLVSGYTSDFSPAKSYLHVAPRRSSKDREFVELAQLEALFFLRDATDEAPSAEQVRETTAPYGRRVALLLPSGEQLTGSTLNYSRQTSGVFMYPSENDFGVARVFVTQSGIQHLKFL
jgi:hypothetical protein